MGQQQISIFKVAHIQINNVAVIGYSPERANFILKLSIKGIIVEDKEVNIFLHKILKHNRPGEALDVITVKAFVYVLF